MKLTSPCRAGMPHRISPWSGPLLSRLLRLLSGMLLCSACFAQGGSPQSQAVPQPDPAPQARVQSAIQALMRHYDQGRGLWDTEGWWNAANTVTVLGDALAIDPPAPYARTLQNTFKEAQKVHPLFRNKFYDDEGWWALAWIQGYDVTHRQEYLAIAQSIFSDMAGGWDNTCGGGIWWSKDRHYKNAIANELFLDVAAHLATRAGEKQRGAYLSAANREWSWFSNSGMINKDSLVNDGLTPDCNNNGRNTWTYNQGVLIGGLVELSAATHAPALQVQAQSIANAALRKLSDSDGVLHDQSEPKCSGDTVQFKGIFMRNLFALQRALPDASYAAFIRANAQSIWTAARTPEDEFSCSWSGPPFDRGAGAATSALDALIAAAAIHTRENP